MSDFARLEDKLAKLRQRERIAGEGRRLRGATAEALLAAVVSEVDETILPRNLSFAVENGATVRLSVANRRLQALVAPAPKLDGLDADKLVGHPLADAEDPAIAEVKKVLLAAFADAAPVSIQSARPEGGGFPSDVGVPSNILARAWGLAEVSGEDISPEDILSRFLAGIGDDAVAWLRIQGEDVTDQGGDASVLEQLGDHAAVFLDGYFGKFEGLYTEESFGLATLVAPVGPGGHGVLFVEIGELSAFIAIKGDRAPELAALWQKVTGA